MLSLCLLIFEFNFDLLLLLLLLILQFDLISLCVFIKSNYQYGQGLVQML